MSRVARRLAALVRSVRAPAGPGALDRAARRRRRDLGWRAVFDEPLLRQLDRLALEQRSTAAGGPGGERRSARRAASTDFVDHRPYLPGDDFRQIDWNAYGRLDQLYVRLTEARERLPLRLLIDCSASMEIGRPSKFDVARQLAGALGYVALARYDPVDLVALAGEAPSARRFSGRARFGELLDWLGSLRCGGALPTRAESARPPAGPPGQSVLISDLLVERGLPDLLARLDREGRAAGIIHLLSPDELDPPGDGDLELVDVESGEIVSVGLVPEHRRRYLRRLADWCEQAREACAGRGLRYVRLATDRPLERSLLVDLREAGLAR